MNFEHYFYLQLDALYESKVKLDHLNNEDALLYLRASRIYLLLSVSNRPVAIIDLSNHNSQNGAQFKSCILILSPFISALTYFVDDKLLFYLQKIYH